MSDSGTGGWSSSQNSTMSGYCDILRSHEATDPLAIEILRFDTEEVLEGTLNGDEELTLLDGILSTFVVVMD